jgi:hypothetical protein
LPTRVLDIGPSLKLDEVRLIKTTSDITAPYIALSHCWGPNQAFTTTTKSFAERKRAIQIEAMPQTFQDAIFVTRLMGFRYLWIDSLCILQDDAGDWLRESACVGSVYSDAYFVIGVARAAADTEGFLSPRKQPKLQLAIDLPTLSGKRAPIVFVPYHNLSGFLGSDPRLPMEPSSYGPSSLGFKKKKVIIFKAIYTLKILKLYKI